jgi:hypothetical protein
MAFRMSVRVEKVLEEGIYDAVLDNVEEKDTKNGERLMWWFRIPSEDDAIVVGWSTLSPSTRAKAYQWAAAIMGEIDPRIGWGLEDVIGGKKTAWSSIPMRIPKVSRRTALIRSSSRRHPRLRPRKTRTSIFPVSKPSTTK